MNLKTVVYLALVVLVTAVGATSCKPETPTDPREVELKEKQKQLDALVPVIKSEIQTAIAESGNFANGFSNAIARSGSYWVNNIPSDIPRGTFMDSVICTTVVYNFIIETFGSAHTSVVQVNNSCQQYLNLLVRIEELKKSLGLIAKNTITWKKTLDLKKTNDRKTSLARA
ncbi:MAG: hypothetical protein LBN95_08865 [Prevotellaceae bacterium]|jgi:hypothetical protein|nr:hypothetical protein [Prevotellaceae bacterium]